MSAKLRKQFTPKGQAKIVGGITTGVVVGSKLTPTHPLAGGIGAGVIGGAVGARFAHPNMRNAKTGVKTSAPQPVKTRGRVGRK